MCSDLLIDKICYWKCFWNDDSAVFWKFCKIYRKISMTELLLRILQSVELPLLWAERSAKYNFSGLIRIAKIMAVLTPKSGIIKASKNELHLKAVSFLIHDSYMSWSTHFSV